MERILVVEDERKLNELIRDYLESLGYQTTGCFDGNQALAECDKAVPDLLVLDVMLPGLDGVEVLRRLRGRHDVAVLMLTARDSEADKLLGLEVGADDYMTKPFSVRELGARVRAILRRSQPAVSARSRRVLKHKDLSVDVERHTATLAGNPVALTTTQFDLLRILIQEPGRVFSRKELMEAISGYVYEGYERTMDVHVKNIRKVLEDDPANPTRLLTVWGVGYKIQE
jgi:DNA-binding response OmpR family regulator